METDNTILFIILGFVALLLIVFSIVIVKQKEAKVIERLGKFNKICRAGINFKIPFIDNVAGKQSLKYQELKVEVDTITKDKVTVKIEVAAQYVVNSDMKSIENSFYELTDPVGQISSYIYDEVRAEVPRLELDDVYEKKDDIADSVKQGLDSAISQFGFTTLKALVTDIDPDQKVKDAMNEINEQKRLRIAAEEKGEAEKILKIKAAEAEAKSKELQGEGIANQRKKIVEGFQESISAFATDTGINNKEVMDFVLITQYFDTLKEMAESNENVIFMPHTSDGFTGRHEMLADLLAAQKSEKTNSLKNQDNPT